MQLKVAPQINVRYWAAIMIASICGANFGDVFPDILKVNTSVSLMMLILLFCALALTDRMTKHGSEALYWGGILIVRAAATNVADFSIKQAHMGYPIAIAMVVVLFGGVLILRRRWEARPAPYTAASTNAFYWLTMFIAGALGTLIGDGVIHAFAIPAIGALTSTALATIALVLFFTLRTGLTWTSVTSYWDAVVLIRWWGTNVGDIFAFFLTLIFSLILSSMVLGLTIWLWREPPTEPLEIVASGE